MIGGCNREHVMGHCDASIYDLKPDLDINPVVGPSGLMLHVLPRCLPVASSFA